MQNSQCYSTTAFTALSMVIAAAALSACSSPTEVRQVDIAAVIVSPEAMTLQVGRKEKFLANTFDANGAPTSAQQLFWSVENPSIARVSATGEVEALSTGTTRVAASVNGHSDIAELTVIPRRVSRAAVSPSSGQVQMGSTLQLQATAYDDWNDPISGRSWSWQSSNTSRATVSSSGLVTGVTPGEVTITASTGGQSASATISVTAAPVASITISPSSVTMLRGQTRQLTATMYDAQNRVVTGHTITWSSNRTSVATVSSSGVVTAVGFGEATITASGGGRSATATVRVQLIPVGSVVIQPSSAEMDTRSSLQLQVRVFGTDGSLLTDRPVSWTSSDTRVATVNGSGLVSSRNREGRTTITATSEGVSGTARVEVDD